MSQGGILMIKHIYTGIIVSVVLLFSLSSLHAQSFLPVYKHGSATFDIDYIIGEDIDVFRYY